MNRQQIAGLDLVRFFSAIAVMLYHFTYWVSNPYGSTPARITGGVFDFTEIAFSFGWVGVEIFFVLSGFVIAYSASGVTAFGFLRSRILRLVPAAWICASITCFVVVVIGDGAAGDIVKRYIRSIIFFPLGPWIDGTYWTLGIEIAFYGAIFILLCVRRFAWMEYFCAAISIVSLILLVAALRSSVVAEWLSSRPANLLLLRHGGEFALGAMLWLLLFEGRTLFRFCIVAVGLVSGIFEISRSVSDHSFTSDVNVVLPISVWIMSIAAIIFSVVYNDIVNSKLTPFASVMIRRMGVATYPLYLLHQLVGSALMLALFDVGVPQLVCLATSMIAMVFAAAIISMYLEPAVASLIRQPLDHLREPFDSALAALKVPGQPPA